MTHLGPLLLAISSLAASPDAPEGPADLELVLISSSRLLWIRLEVSAAGVPARAGWDRAFRALFDAADRDGDGRLDPSEAGWLPSAFALRQGYPYLNAGSPPAWDALDRDGGGTVGPDEVAAFYRGERIGGVQVGFGGSVATPALNAAILGLIHRAAPDAIRGADLDEDELISPAELVEGTPQPASMSAEDLCGPGVPRPLLVLPSGPERGPTLARLFRRLDLDSDGALSPAESRLPIEIARSIDRDGDSRLDPAEFASRFDRTADARHAFRLDPDGPVPPVELVAGDLTLSIATTPGTLPENLRVAARRLRSQFGEADTNRDGQVAADESDAPNAAELRRAIAPADRDADRVLTLGELDAWIALQGRIVDGHATLAVIDHGPSLFEFLDADRDGRLSRREFASARTRLAGAGAIARDGTISIDDVPRTLAATLTRGRARGPYQPPRPGPPWFRAMDRNRDGDLSRAEYLGSPADFDRLDADRDALLTPAEAAPGGPERSGPGRP